MSLQLTQELPAYDRPFPKVGCGLKFCFEEDDFVLSVGSKSFIDFVVELFDIVVAGDVLFLHGVKFSFVSGAPSNLQEIQITGGAGTAANLLSSLNQIPFFIDNYTINSPAAFRITLTNKKNKIDGNWQFLPIVANVNSIILNPFASQSQGSNPVTKQDYYIFFDIIDNQTGEKLCLDSLERPLNVFSNGTNKVCVNVQPIIENYPLIFTALPTPFQPITIGTNKADNFDENYFRDFYFRFWNSYKDTSSSAANCDKVQSDLIQVPTGSRILKIANFAQKQTQCSLNGFFDYSFPAIAPFSQKFITAMPESYLLCQDSAVELRFDYPVATINFLGGLVRAGVIVNYTDGTASFVVFDWDTNLDGCQILNLSFGSGAGNYTIPITAGKKILSVVVSIYHILFATVFENLELKILNFDTRVNAKVKCCQEHETFYFLSSVGNNDIIIGKEIETSLDVEFYEFCKEQTCCGFERFGVKEQTGGKITTAISSEDKIHTILIETDEIEYLEEFLLSSFKYIYDKDSDTIFQILPTKKSFSIWKKNFKTFIEFTFRKSFLRNSLKA
jgi:hypothetical protein